MPTRQLVANLTSSGTWVQLTQGVGGSAYTVPTGSQATTRLISGLNLGANAVTVDLAISTNNTIADGERILRPIELGVDYSFDTDDVHIIGAGEGLWARATGTSPNVTIRASALETEQ